MIDARQANFEFRRVFDDKNHPLPQDDAQVERLRRERADRDSELERLQGAQGLAYKGIILIIDALIFWLHWPREAGRTAEAVP